MNLSNNTVIHKNENGIQYLQFRKLLEYEDKIVHAYNIGLDVDYRTYGDKLPEAKKNYDRFCKTINLDVNNLVKPIQNHTKKVKIINEKNIEGPIINNDMYDNTDGVITNKDGIVLATTNADCILMLFYDPIKNVIANIHSGWRGTYQRISIETVNKMQKEYKCKAEDIICCMCPSIRKCHFEVEKEVKDMFYNEFKDLKEIDDIIEETVPNQKWHIDTILINRVILKQAGLKPENIIDSGICSVCNSEIMHSCRAEGEGYGLNTAVISLR